MNHIIYKTTCLTTGRYYIGMHSTDDLDDGYLGSGKHLIRSIEKHGVEQHYREVLEHLPTREALRSREAELVTEELINDRNCMNMQLGGGPGFDYVNKQGLRWTDARREEMSELMKARIASGLHVLHQELAFKGRTHSEETKQKLSKASTVYNGNRLPPEVIEQRLSDARVLDPKIRGNITKLSKLWGISPPKAGKFLENYFSI